MSVDRLAYVVNARLPTEKAHGLQIAKMCEAFAGLGCDVTVFSPRRRQSDATLAAQSLQQFYGLRAPIEHVLLPNMDVIPLEAWMPERAFQGVFLAHALVWAFSAAVRVQRRPADLYFTRDVACAYWLSRFGLPTVLELHAVPHGPQRALLRSLPRQSGFRGLVTLTGFTAAEVGRLGFEGVPTVVLADGADVERFAAAPTSAESRQRLGLPLDRPLVGYVGGFRTIGQEKGVAPLVGAMRHVREVPGLQAATLVCVGGEPEAHGAYHSLAARCGLPEDAVLLRSRVPHHEVPMWLRACDVLTVPFPNHPHFAYYASPLKIFEYMAAGGAIVASDLPAIREVLEDGRNALLVSPGDQGDLARAIAKLLVDRELAERYRAAASRDAERYDWTSRAGQVLGFVSQPAVHAGGPVPLASAVGLR